MTCSDRSARDLTESADGHARLLARNARYLIATAARAPSVHNSQPWRFRVGPRAVELWADPGRKVEPDALGREMLISCGAALFGLRLAVRSLGYGPVVELLPDLSRLKLLARVSIGPAVPMNGLERQMLAAVPQRDFDLGRGLARLPGGGAPPAVTAVLLTAGDRRADWLRAGQALHRLLLHAAARWVFASLYTQPLEDAVTRALIREELALPGHPQMLLQLGRAESTVSTPRRPPGELTT